MQEMSSKKNVAQKYKLLEVIGRGKFGTVHKAMDVDTKHIIAVKILNLDTDNEEVKDIQQEIGFLSKLKTAPNITHYFGSYLNGHKLWILMDYCAGGSVRTLLKPGPLNEKYISIIARELFIALQFIHENGVIHRDIKAANILISKEGRVKLCDFGVAVQLTSTALKRTTMAGTPYWMAPEVIREGATYNSKADVWSAGITIYEMATGNPPYSDKDALRAMQIITQHEPPRLEGRQYSSSQKEIIALCLEEDPESRPSAETILKSKFIKNSKALPTTVLKEVIGKYLVWRDNRSKMISSNDVNNTPNAEMSDQSNNNNNNNNKNNTVVNTNNTENKISHHQNPSIVSIPESYISLEENENIKWDFDSLKSVEYIVENDIVLQSEDNYKFDESEYENNYRDFTTSPYNKTFTIGNTLMNGVNNDSRITTASGTVSASTTQIDSIINSFDQLPKIVEPPKSLLSLFPDSSNTDNTVPPYKVENESNNSIDLNNVIERNTDKHRNDYNDATLISDGERYNFKNDTSIDSRSDKNMASQSQHFERSPSITQIRQPIVNSPLISIEIPNMDSIESEIQEREKQRSRAATVNNNLNNIHNNSNNNIKHMDSIEKSNESATQLRYDQADQALPLRRPTISLAYSNRTPSPAKLLEQINTNLLPTTQEQTSPLHMKPLPVSSQPLLQPLNGAHKGKPQINLAGISNHKAISNNGPQTAPVVSSTNAELFDSALKARNPMRIQMPVPVSATVSSFPNTLNQKASDGIQKNQFGFEINSTSTVPMAMTPVTERSHPGMSTPDKDLSKREISTDGHFNNSSSNNSYFSSNTNPTSKMSLNSENVDNNIKKIPIMQNNLAQKHPAASIISPTSNIKSGLKSSSNIANLKYGNGNSSANISTLNSGNIKSGDSSVNLERKMSFESSLKFQPSQIYPQFSQSNNSNNGVNESEKDDGKNEKDESEKLITGLGMMRINDNGNVSPMKAASSESRKDQKLPNYVKNSQKSLEKVTNFSLNLNDFDFNSTSSGLFYSTEIDNLLDNMTGVLDLMLNDLK